MESSLIIYYGGITLAAAFAGVSQKINNKSQADKVKKLHIVFWLLSMVVLIFIFGLRKAGVGVDDGSYERIFKETSQNGLITQFFNTTMEPGYLLLNYLISLFTSDFQVVIFITTAISIIFYYKALKHEEQHISMFWGVFLLGTLLLIYFCGIIRLMIACSIIAYSCRFIMEKKPVKYVIFVLLATSFHYSAIFMIFLLYFAIGKIKKSNIRFIILAAVIMPIIIYVVSNYIFPNMGDRYNHYSDVTNTSITLDMFDKVPFILLAIIFAKEISKTNKQINIYISIYAMSIIFSIYSIFMDIGRMQWYCMFSMCIILPSILEVLKKVKNQEFAYLYIPVLIFYAILYSYRILMGSSRESMLLYENILFQ